MKRFVYAAFLCVILLVICACATGNSASQPSAPAQSAAPAIDPSKLPETVSASIDMGEYGVIKLELYPQKAPQSVCNFCELARKGFYDGLIFHRVIEGFMIQGGDPTGTGMGGPGYGIKGEFSENGFENDLSHIRGTISMARSMAPDSAGSQFFITHKDRPDLDGKYAAFGRVVDGIDVVDRIACIRTGSEDRPYKDIVIKSVTIDGPELPSPEKIPE